MELVAVIKAISEIGVLLLCGAVVIWQVINDRNRQSKRNSERLCAHIQYSCRYGASDPSCTLSENKSNFAIQSNQRWDCRYHRGKDKPYHTAKKFQISLPQLRQRLSRALRKMEINPARRRGASP